MVIFLVGYMGCGKSTVGAVAARRLGFRFVDMDRELEREAGCSVSEIFARSGEEGFRAMEREFIERMSDNGGDCVVATGGGAPCFGDNMRRLNEAGVTVYFKMSPEKLASRLRFGRAKRPLIRDLGDEELQSFIAENLERREPYYSQARLVIDCDGASDEYIADHIVADVRQRIELSRNTI